MIEGHIEALSEGGVVAGWVEHAGSPTPAHVQMILAGQIVAEAIADAFRRDLLRAGRGHGHFGFAARLRRPLPPGPILLQMHLPEAGLGIPMRLAVPALDPPHTHTVEALLIAAPSWTTDDLIAHPACLGMQARHARLGTARFIDAVFRFVLRRWPSAAETRMNTDGLDSGRITPDAMLLDYLRSRERADMPPCLPSPFDPDFPFTA